MLETVGGSLRRVIPIVLAHHDKFDGSGYHPSRGNEIPIEARIISVADVYDSLTSDRPYRKAMSPFEAKDIIVKGAATDFDPRVVDAFLSAFQFGEMDAKLAVA
jgi:HD-GYP domain-containing protein (c-di-GMP phosphodiesterase class II)